MFTVFSFFSGCLRYSSYIITYIIYTFSREKSMLKT